MPRPFAAVLRVALVVACAPSAGCRRLAAVMQTIPPDADVGVFDTGVARPPPPADVGVDRPPADTAPPRPDVADVADAVDAVDAVDVAPPPPVVAPAPSEPPLPAPGELVPGGLSDLPGRPIRCSGDRVIFLDRVSIDNPTGPAVRASGNCAVRISNCTLRGDVGVSASGRATVHLSRCRVTGARYAVEATQRAAVRLTGCALAGPTRQDGRGVVDSSP